MEVRQPPAGMALGISRHLLASARHLLICAQLVRIEEGGIHPISGKIEDEPGASWYPLKFYAQGGI